MRLWVVGEGLVLKKLLVERLDVVVNELVGRKRGREEIRGGERGRGVDGGGRGGEGGTRRGERGEEGLAAAKGRAVGSEFVEGALAIVDHVEFHGALLCGRLRLRKGRRGGRERWRREWRGWR